MPSQPEKASPPSPQLRTAFKVILVLASLALAEAAGVFWLLRTPAKPDAASSFVLRAAGEGNLIKKKFPEVDFTAIYPGMSAADIDQMQRDFLGMRYVYAPFVEFEPEPVSGRFLNILPGGFRRGGRDAPWPPARNEFVVFVFGGSTTLGFGLPDGQTLVSALESVLSAKVPGRTVRCYNFGRGYYFSTQERILFETLLQRGIVPNVALFVDGLNEFIYHDGTPHLAPTLFKFTAPDRPTRERIEPTDDAGREAAVRSMIERYKNNIRLTEAAGHAYGVSVIFVGQPVPFIDFPVRDSTYPFHSTFAEHQLAAWGYARFKEAGRQDEFGERFVWCGNAFAKADRIMYADSIHYSPAGAEVLARCIVERAMEVGLLP